MNYVKERLNRILTKIDNMTVEDYNKFYDRCKAQRNVRKNIKMLAISWDKYNNDKKIYLKRFKSFSTCNGCWIYEKKLIRKLPSNKKKKYIEICEKGKCIENSKTFIYKKVVPLKRYEVKYEKAN